VSTGSSPIGSPDAGNGVAIIEAARHDMGLLIISPFDKGGKLYEPSPELVTACLPLVPLQYGALWIWRHQEIHTISIGPWHVACSMICADIALLRAVCCTGGYVLILHVWLRAVCCKCGYVPIVHGLCCILYACSVDHMLCFIRDVMSVCCVLCDSGCCVQALNDLLTSTHTCMLLK
jgi:hypothetical protein